jgi:aminomethyltransferase
MGYVAKEYSTFGTAIYVKVRNKLLKAKVVKVPFVSLQ